MYFLLNLLVFIASLSILITVHEFGHFYIARKFNVEIECFSIGFGRTIFQWYGKNGIKYIISAIPLGGYVKMIDNKKNTDILINSNNIFKNKSIWIRGLIILAGPIFNFLFSILIYWLVFLIGITSYSPVIGGVEINSIAEEAQINPGMELKLIDEVEVTDWNSVRLQLISKIGKNNITLGVKKSNSTEIYKKSLDLKKWKFEPNKQDVLTSLGILPYIPHTEIVVINIDNNSAAMKAGIKIGDKILTINNQFINGWEWFKNKIINNPIQKFNINVERKGINLNFKLQLKNENIEDKKSIDILGITPKIIYSCYDNKILKKYNLIYSLLESIKQTYQLIKITINLLINLIIGNLPLNNIGGPISIADGAKTSIRYGLIYYLMFLALISINLGIVNLLPIPVLDGGHLFFLIIEKFKGKPLSDEIINLSYQIGSIILIIIMCFSIFNDFSRL